MEETQQNEINSAVLIAAVIAVLVPLMADFAIRNGTDGLRQALDSTKANLPDVMREKGWDPQSTEIQAVITDVFGKFEQILAQFSEV